MKSWLFCALFAGAMSCANAYAGLTVDSQELSDSISESIGNAEALKRQRAAEAEERARQRKANRSEYELTHPPCEGSDDACYSITGVAPGGRRYFITCTHGSHAGEKLEVCGNDKGRWAAGCGVTSTFAYHYDSVKAAARQACDL